jgi:hypothetical protein
MKTRRNLKISNWRKEVSIPAESGSVSDNFTLNTKKRNIFENCKVTNTKGVAQLVEKFKQIVQAKAQQIGRYEKRKS